MAWRALPPVRRAGWLALSASTLALGTVVYGLSLPGGASASLGPLTIGWEGVRIGAEGMLKVIAILSLGLLAAQWIPADGLLNLVARRPLPFYIVATMVRMVPTLREDWHRIRLAQQARGHRVHRPFLRPASQLPLLVPVFVTALRRAREQAIALRLARVPKARGAA